MWRFLLLMFCATFCGGITPALAERNYTVRFPDGSYHEGLKLTNWHDPNAQPQVDGRSLLEPNRWFRWVRSHQLGPKEAPTEFVELITGDIMPGVITEYVAEGSAMEELPPHFVVEPRFATLGRDNRTPPTIRVVASAVKRIVWQGASTRRASAPLRLKSGSEMTYRAVRFTRDGVSLLTSDGNRKFSFSELAELELPASDYWQRYFEEVAILCPSEQSRLYQMETVDGLSATASLERTSIYSFGNAEEADRWVHGIQPAWSLDLLWVPTAQIWLRRSFAPHEVPLSRVPPVQVEHRGVLKQIQPPWRRDRNALGELPRNGKQEIGFNVGVVSTTTLHWALPPEARAFRAQVGIDRVAGSGGCVQPKIECLSPQRNVLWEGSPLVGSDARHDVGHIMLPNSDQPRSLLLTVDALHQGRPAGADPFEIRDFVDWIEPLLELDEAACKKRLAVEIAKGIPAWRGWQPAPVKPDVVLKHQQYYDKSSYYPRFELTTSTNGPVSWRKRLTLSSADRWLLVYASRTQNHGDDARVELRVDQEFLDAAKLPFKEDDATRERPLVFSLIDVPRGKEPVDLELRWQPGGNPAAVQWRAVRAVSDLPFLRRVFDDETTWTGPGTLLATDGFVGSRSMRVPGGQEVKFEFDPPLKIRERPLPGEQRLLRITLKKQGGGQILLRWQGNFATATPPQHVVGRGTFKPVDDKTKMWDDEFKDHWVQITRDLYGDLGPVDLTSVSLVVPDGEWAACDEFYAMQRYEDIAYVTRQPAPGVGNRDLPPEVLKIATEGLQKSTVLIELPEQRTAAGVLYHWEGYVLTAGHVLPAPNTECTVITPDGKRHASLTRGVCRDFDLGVVKIKEISGVSGVGINGWQMPEPGRIFVAAGFGEKENTIMVSPTDVRRVTPLQIWTQTTFPRPLPGSPLVDVNGHLVGVLQRYSSRSTGVYSPLMKWGDYEGRLKNGEVWGQWLEGSAPHLGVKTEYSAAGLVTKTIEPTGPLAHTELKPDDVLVNIDNQPLFVPDDIERVLATRDAGQEVTVNARRGAQNISVKAKLAPRGL